MNKHRFKYFIFTLITIILGLLSRKVSFIPLSTGDLLWAVMITFIFRFLFYKKSILFCCKYSLLFCFFIEFSQLYQAPFINSIRRTTLGHLVLGQGFLYSDLVAYSVGVLLAYFIIKLETNFIK